MTAASVLTAFAQGLPGALMVPGGIAIVRCARAIERVRVEYEGTDGALLSAVEYVGARRSRLRSRTLPFLGRAMVAGGVWLLVDPSAVTLVLSLTVLLALAWFAELAVCEHRQVEERPGGAVALGAFGRRVAFAAAVVLAGDVCLCVYSALGGRSDGLWAALASVAGLGVGFALANLRTFFDDVDGCPRELIDSERSGRAMLGVVPAALLWNLVIANVSPASASQGPWFVAVLAACGALAIVTRGLPTYKRMGLRKRG